jgi:hypothetical protein
MDRRTFIHSVAGGYLAGQLVTGASAQTVPPGNVTVNFTGKVRGANLTTKPGYPLQSAMWIAWDWDGWIRPQIDCAVALGCNAVRLMGDVAMVMKANLSQSTYNARWQQVVAYCVSQGLAVYYTGCSPYDTNGQDNGNMAAYNANPQAFADVMKSSVAAVTSGSTDYTASIIGLDLVQEANSWGKSDAVRSLYSMVRPFVPRRIPCTFSTSDLVQSTTWIPSIISACDFLDYHVYPQIYGITGQPSAAAFTRGPRAAYPNKDILFGEGGASSGGRPAVYRPAEVAAWLNGLASLGNMPDPHIRGALMWALQDQDDQYGAFDASWSPRPWVAGPWIRYCRLAYLPTTAAVRDASPDGTRVPPARAINDGSGGVWTLGAQTGHGRQILLNSGPVAGGQGTVILWSGGRIKVMNSDGNWYSWNGTGWLPTENPLPYVIR